MQVLANLLFINFFFFFFFVRTGENLQKTPGVNRIQLQIVWDFYPLNSPAAASWRPQAVSGRCPLTAVDPVTERLAWPVVKWYELIWSRDLVGNYSFWHGRKPTVPGDPLVLL
jgi:hypothetical protein